jgi:PilZ domain-containing protein
MKTTRLNSFFTSVVNTFAREEKTSTGIRAGKAAHPGVYPRPQRKDFPYYMQIIDADTKEIVGHLADLSSGGFKLDSRKPIPINKDVRFLMNLPGEIANKPHMVFGARSRWCQIDPLDPCAFNVGYQLTRILPEDLEIFNRMMEKYGSDCKKKNIDLRRPYKW